MYMINRAAAIIKPKKPFLDWVNAHPDSAGREITMEQLREDSTAYLLPEFESIQEAEDYIKDLSSDIFEIELELWYRDDQFWPQKRDYQKFLDWFEVEVHSMVLDPYENEILREDY